MKNSQSWTSCIWSRVVIKSLDWLKTLPWNFTWNSRFYSDMLNFYISFIICTFTLKFMLVCVYFSYLLEFYIIFLFLLWIKKLKELWELIRKPISHFQNFQMSKNSLHQKNRELSFLEFSKILITISSITFDRDLRRGQSWSPQKFKRKSYNVCVEDFLRNDHLNKEKWVTRQRSKTAYFRIFFWKPKETVWRKRASVIWEMIMKLKYEGESKP